MSDNILFSKTLEKIFYVANFKNIYAFKIKYTLLFGKTF